MITPQYKLYPTASFHQKLTLSGKNFADFVKKLQPDTDIHIRLKGLSGRAERFVLFALSGYQRCYPQRKINIKKQSKCYQMESFQTAPSSFKPRFLLNLQITGKCNFACKHCYNQNKSKHVKSSYLTLEVIEKMCRQFLSVRRAADFKHRAIYLLGGEPFLHPQLPEIITMISKIKVSGLYFNYVALSSNGLLVPKNIDLLKRGRDLFEIFPVQISIDGDKKTYPKIRGRKIDIALKALDILAKNNIIRQISFTVSKQNRFNIEYILELCEKYNATPHITPYAPFNPDLEVLSRAEWETFKLAVIGMLKKEYRGVCGFERGCAIGWNGISVDSEGYIIGCPRDPQIVGHIDKIPLDDGKLWRTGQQGPFVFYGRCGKYMKNDFAEQRKNGLLPLSVNNYN
ncbi:MAG: radical SAM protein [Planctomycetes bacterium]|nr:radical SAM protein [Planctomycetota bacterium]